MIPVITASVMAVSMLTTSVVTTSVMDISVIAILMMPISDTSDHCIGDGGICDDHVSADDVWNVYIHD